MGRDEEDSRKVLHDFQTQLHGSSGEFGALGSPNEVGTESGKGARTPSVDHGSTHNSCLGHISLFSDP